MSRSYTLLNASRSVAVIRGFRYRFLFMDFPRMLSAPAGQNCMQAMHRSQDAPKTGCRLAEPDLSFMGFIAILPTGHILAQVPHPVQRSPAENSFAQG